MNMFRDILICVLIGLAIGLTFGEPEKWAWVDRCGPYVLSAFSALITTRPISSIICLALALALFMTRLKY